MIIVTRDIDVLYSAASRVGVRLSIAHIATTRDGRRRVRLQLKPLPKGLFRRIGFAFYKRHIDAVCAHGYYYFFCILFDLDPSARVKSSMTDKEWITVDNLEWYKDMIYQRNIGSQLEPVEYQDACLCNKRPCPVFGCTTREYFYSSDDLKEHLETRHPKSVRKHGIIKLLEMAENLR